MIGPYASNRLESLKMLTMFNFPIIWFYKFKVEGGQNNVEITINFSKKRSNELM